jgi:hypothetical protein
MRKTIIFAFATAGLAVCAVVTDLVRDYAGDASVRAPGHAQTMTKMAAN